MSRALRTINGKQGGPQGKTHIPFPNEATFLSADYRAGLRPYSPVGTTTELGAGHTGPDQSASSTQAPPA
eukprot:15448511-Heterocapsa_arctica.AAC.1